MQSKIPRFVQDFDQKVIKFLDFSGPGIPLFKLNNFMKF